MSQQNTIDLLEELGYEDVVVFSNPSYETAFIGISDDNRAIYDFDLMVDYLVKECNMSVIDSIEFIEYNSIRSLPYTEGVPIIMYRLD